MKKHKASPLMILFIQLGVGGVERKIVDIVNFLATYRPSLPIYILVRRRAEFDLSREIKNKNVQTINYTEWARVKFPYFFPVFVFYQIFKLKPKAVLAFLDFVSIPVILSKLILFWRKTIVVLSEDHYASKIISTYRFSPVRHLCVRLFYPYAKTIFVCSQANKKDLVSSYNIPAQKIRIIRNWTVFRPKKIEKRQKKYDLIYVGRLTKTKNIQLLLKSVQKLRRFKKNIKFCIVGEGEERKSLEKDTKRLGIESNVVFLGARYRVEEILIKAKLFVFSSLVRAEGFPLAILEAMAVGVPVLTRKFAGSEEFLKDGKNCWLFRSEKDLVKKAFRLLNSSLERERIAKQAGDYVRKYHSPNNLKEYLGALEL